MLYTIGIGAAATALCGCGGEDGDDTGVPAGVAAMCGADLCLKLSDNPELGAVGGIVFLSQAPGKKIFVQRTDAGFLALSAVCTHAGCTVSFNGADRFNCPCHGSSFAVDGAVVNGPAARPLDEFAVAVNGDDLTITLA